MPPPQALAFAKPVDIKTPYIRIRKTFHERSISCCRGLGHTWNVADVALRITKALLNWKWFCTGGGRGPVNLFNLYATMLRVDVEEEDSVLLVPDTTCLLGPCKNTPWTFPKYPEMNCVAGATHTFLLPTATHHDSKVHVAYPQCRVVMKQPLPFKSSPQWLGYSQVP